MSTPKLMDGVALVNFKYGQPLVAMPDVVTQWEWAFKYDPATYGYQVLFTNKDTRKYLGWDVMDKAVVLSTTEHWWIARFVPRRAGEQILLGLQVPSLDQNPEGFLTLTMRSDDYVVSLYYCAGELRDEDLWIQYRRIQGELAVAGQEAITKSVSPMYQDETSGRKDDGLVPEVLFLSYFTIFVLGVKSKL
ncbi:hypothetical protein BDR04DRAFT_1234772 [Suillus decipiens]|nr:hypothetical protein BDR04DRAFT_1234772 [Suillus decipiens]